MTLPTQADAYVLVLNAIANSNKELSRIEIIHEITDSLILSDEEKEKKTKSGALVYQSRIGWAISFLANNGLFDQPCEEIFRINERGREVYSLGMNPAQFTAYIVSPVFQNAGKRNIRPAKR